MPRPLALAITVAVSFVTSAVPPAWAQRTTGSLIGVVRDSSGGILPGVSVTVNSVSVPGAPTTTTSDAGRYQFAALPPGVYDVTFALTGFATIVRQGIAVGLGAPTELDAALSVGGVSDTVTVTADTATINTTSSQLSARFDDEWLRAAPINRSYFELLRMGPGVSVGTSAAPVAFTVFGSGVNDNLFQLDGSDQNTSHAANTAPAVFPNPEILQEVEFLALGAPAEYGAFMGGVFNAVTRQGSNAFHGDANVFVQTGGLTSRNTTDAEDGGRPFTRDRFHDASVQLGGPIVRDRAWFFASYQDTDDVFSQVGADPTFPTGTRIERGFAKLTLQPSPSHRVVASFNPSWYEGIAAGSAFVDPSTVNRGPQKGFTPSAEWHATLGPRTSLEVRGNYYWSNYTAQPPEGEPEVKTRYVALDSGRTTGGVQLVGESIYKRTSVSAKVTTYSDRFLGGSHDVRLGVQYQRGRADNSFYYNDIVYTMAGQPQNGYIQVQSEYGANPSQAGVFVDDAFRPSSRLTVDVGVRYDRGHLSVPAFPEFDRRRQPTGRELPAIDDLVTWHQVSPRLGFNLKVDADGHTVVKGHYGRYYQSASVAAAFYRVLPSASPRYAFSGRYDAAGDPIDLVPISVASNRQLDDGLGSPRTDQYVIGLEHALAGTIGITGHFVYKRGSHYTGWQDVGGRYEPATYVDAAGTDASGQPIGVLRLAGPASERFFLLTDPDALFSRYRGVMLGIQKRLSGGWQLSSTLTLSKSTGRLVSSNSGPASPQNSTPIFSSFGQNPNDFVNSDDLLIGDRPVLWKTQLVATLPWDVTLAASHQYLSGRSWGRTIRVPDLGLTTTIRAEPLDGSRRLDALNLFDVRVEKTFRLGPSLRVAGFIDALNLFNGDAFENVASTLGSSAAFGAPTTVQIPRRLMLGARVRF